MENPCKIVCFGDSITKGYCSRFERKIKNEWVGPRSQTVIAYLNKTRRSMTYE
jgi:lysophospholipase L1-like esterase